jgi:uncharacterized glyoxalase superfamily protein PhnB
MAKTRQSDEAASLCKIRSGSIAVRLDSAAGRRSNHGSPSNMPYAKTFWADGFGMVVDKFGTPWTVNAGDGDRPPA